MRHIKKGILAKTYSGQILTAISISTKVQVHIYAVEETALLESIEGRRGRPRIKPPFPALAGLYAKPTVINNVETLSCISHIVNRGAKWFASIGPEKSPGPKLFGVSGHVNKPGMYELPMGTTAREIIYNHAGGISDSRKLKAFIPGGVSAPMLTERDLDTPMDFDSLAAKGTMLGSGGIIVMDETACIVKVAMRTMGFFRHESCGKCTPCREGTDWTYKVLQRIERGEGKEGDVELLEKLCGNIFGRTFCPLGDGAVMALRGALKHFRDEFVYHVKNKKCMESLNV